MDDKRKVVGYISTFEEKDQTSLAVQQRMIQRYCQKNQLICNHIFCDIGARANRTISEIKRMKTLGFQCKKWSIVYEQWEEMLLQIAEDEISIILVDSKIRVNGIGRSAKQIFEKLVAEHQVTVIEVGLMIPDEAVKSEAVIYHHTVQKEASIVAIKNIDKLYHEAAHQGWAVASCYIDDTGDKKRLYQRLKKECSEGKFGAVFLYKAYRLNRNADAFFHCLTEFTNAQVALYTLEEGKLTIMKSEEYFVKPQKVAVYDRARSRSEEFGQKLLKEIIKVFCRTKTMWTIKGWFLSDTNEPKDKAFGELLVHIDEYDLIFINRFASLDSEVSKLFMMKKSLKNKPIFCMKEDVLLL